VVKVTFREQNGGACPAPGPGEFPLGAAITLADPDRDPHPWLARLRATEPVSWLPALHGWLVTRHDLAVAVMWDSALPGLRLDPAHPAAPRDLVFRKPPSLRVRWTA
jgi:hypothetical protein